jgi:tripartite motif-containing protein 71
VRTIDGGFEAQHPLAPTSGVGVDSKGNVYAFTFNAQPASQRVVKFDATGAFVKEWGSAGAGPGQFATSAEDGSFFIGALFVDSRDNVWVADSFNYRVQKFDSDGNFLLQIGQIGTGPGQFPRMVAKVAVDASDNVYISCLGREVQKFDSAGKYLATIGEGRAVFTDSYLGLWVHDFDSEGNLLATDTFGNGNTIFRLDPKGKALQSFGPVGRLEDKVFEPTDLAIDKAGRIYVGQNGPYGVNVYDRTGAFIRRITEDGTGNTFRAGTPVVRGDTLYISDAFGRIHLFTIPA